ncbi:MAG TPA: hypothetical protein VF546_24250 [Pyrinomonadaceae bacterium]|jgi:hypothetical protein
MVRKATTRTKDEAAERRVKVKPLRVGKETLKDLGPGEQRRVKGGVGGADLNQVQGLIDTPSSVLKGCA